MTEILEQFSISLQEWFMNPLFNPFNYLLDRREVLGTVSYRRGYSLYSCCVLLHRKACSAVLGNGVRADQPRQRERRQALYRKNPAEEGNYQVLYDWNE